MTLQSELVGYTDILKRCMTYEADLVFLFHLLRKNLVQISYMGLMVVNRGLDNTICLRACALFGSDLVESLDQSSFCSKKNVPIWGTTKNVQTWCTTKTV